MNADARRLLAAAIVAFVCGAAATALVALPAAPRAGGVSAAAGIVILAAALAVTAGVGLSALARANRTTARIERAAGFQKKLSAVLDTRRGSVADQAVVDFLKAETGCGAALLARTVGDGSMLSVDTETRAEARIKSEAIPAPWSQALAEGAAAVQPGEVLIPLVADGHRLGIVVLRRCRAAVEERSFATSLQEPVSSEFAAQIRRQEEEYRKLRIIEDAYRLSEARLRAIFDESRDMILTIDGDGRIIDINKAGARLLGFDADSFVIGRMEADFWSNEGDHAIFMTQISEQGWVKDFEVILKRKDGSTVFGLESATLFRNRDGSVQEIHAMVKDITQRIHDEQSLWKMNIELAGANQRLRDSQALLVQQEKLASIGQLAAGVAHEINNPLAFLKSNHSAVRRGMTAIKELVAGLVVTPEIEEAKKRLDIDYIVGDFDAILQESDDGFRRITDIVQNLKNFSRIDSSERYALFDINKGIENTLAVARNEVKYVAEVKLDLGQLPMVECLGGEINQVFLNLLVNAAQAIKSQGRTGLGTISISTSCRDERVSIEIADDGPGIPKGIQMRIFDPFYTTKPVGQGTGLGLSISSDIVVNKHKGRLTVESEPGAGARFRIELPVKHPADDAPSEPITIVPLR